MLCDVVAVSLTWLPAVCEKSDFSLAERNEISEKCFSHTPLGPGYRSCDLSGGQLFLLRPPLLTFPPTHPKVLRMC